MQFSKVSSQRILLLRNEGSTGRGVRGIRTCRSGTHVVCPGCRCDSPAIYSHLLGFILRIFSVTSFNYMITYVNIPTPLFLCFGLELCSAHFITSNKQSRHYMTCGSHQALPQNQTPGEKHVQSGPYPLLSRMTRMYVLAVGSHVTRAPCITTSKLVDLS
jgi:hypothetical protein